MEVLKETGGKRSIVDGRTVTWKREGRLEGIMCMFMNDLCFGRTNHFQRNIMNHITKKLRVRTEESIMFKYIGIDIMDRERNMITIILE